MTIVSSAQPNPHPIAELLSQRAIKKIAIIDDAYDERSRDELSAGEVDDFWNELEFNNEPAMHELVILGIKIKDVQISSADDIDDGILQELWNRRDTLGALREPVRTLLFPSIIEKVDQLEQFYTNLNEGLTLEVARLGRNFDINESLAATSLVFIDYYLGPEMDQRAIKKSNDIAKEIYEKYSSSEMPLIILMSSDPSVDKHKEEFLEESGLLSGLFYFVPKDDLVDKDKLFLKLGAWAMTLPTGSDLQRFVNALETSIDRRGKEFIKDVKQLSIEDYAYIQKLSLQEEGHPLGDYMLWLYNSYLGHLLFESDTAITEQRKVIDRLSHDHLPPSQTMPSMQLIKIYNSALFEMEVEDVGAHPSMPLDKDAGDKQTPIDPSIFALYLSLGDLWLEPDESKEKVSDVLPYLHLGDLFIKDVNSEVLMLINAECDLAFTPDLKRVCDPKGTILLITGQLQPLNEGGKPSGIRTEFFEYQGKTNRILWNTKRVISHEYGKIFTWLKKEGYQRKARLRLPFALEIQRAFASDLTRVGLPVAPPIYQPVKVQLLRKSEDGMIASLLAPQENSAFIVSTRSGMQCFFTVEFGYIFKRSIRQLIEIMQKFRDKLASSEDDRSAEIGKVAQQMTSLDRLLENFDKWFLQLSPFQLPQSDSIKPLPNIPIGIYRNRDTKEPYTDKQALLINIIDA